MLAPLLSILLFAAPPPAITPPPMECHVSNGTQACGYHCVIHPKGVRCAQTPEGFCQVLDGEVVCFDPPEEVRLHPPKGATPVARCRSKRSSKACGYTCDTSPTEIACASTPYGTCISRRDTVTCWDPTPQVIHHYSSELSGARCVATLTQVACGWDCKTSYQSAACAQTPRGRCSLYEGRVLCVDPPVPSISHESVVASQSGQTGP